MIRACYGVLLVLLCCHSSAHVTVLAEATEKPSAKQDVGALPEASDAGAKALAHASPSAGTALKGEASAADARVTKKPITSDQDKSPYVVNRSSRGKPLYHLIYDVESANVVDIERMSRERFDTNGGQFELRIRKSSFPIEAPNCDSNIIVRMPWVDASGDKLDAKYALYSQLIEVADGERASVTVSLELNPYVEASGDGVALTYCNVFFRHGHGQYVPHNRPLE